MGIRLLVLAALGLGALYLLHLLAQDYQSIKGRWLFKRDLNSQNSVSKVSVPVVRWDFILSQDPIKCARSLFCQIAAIPDDEVEETHQVLIEMVRFGAGEKESWGYNEIVDAYTKGRKSANPEFCRRIYYTCPFSADTMLNIMSYFT